MRVATAVACFFLSGVAALVYEVCWIRTASLVFGSTTHALSTVLAVYFLGLALGSWGFGRVAHRTTRPLLLYAALEIGVGLLALASPWLFARAEHLYGHAYRATSADFGPLFAVRFALVALVLLPPTVLLGGTFPLFVRQVVTQRGRIAAPVGLLYAVNTMGAAVGCALAGFLLVPGIGVQRTLGVGAALSVLAGATVASLGLARARDPAPDERTAASPRSEIVLSALFFVTGFVALASQVLWTRYLTLLVRTTVVTYTITITVVLAGIVIGSVVAAPLFDRPGRRALAFGGLQVSTGLALLGVMLLPPAAWQRMGTGIGTYVLLLLPAAALSGASFPLAIRMVVNEPSRAGAGVGRMAALNTLGGIAGSLVLGFGVLPAFGLETGLLLTSGTAVAAGVAAWWSLRERTSSSVRGALTIVAIGLWLAVPRILDTRVPADFLALHGNVVDFREGLAANVAAVQGEEALRLEIDGWWQGENRKGHQIMAAHVPMILHPARDVLVVGAGVGQTASRFLLHDVRRLDCVELEPAVFDVVREHFDSSWMDDPRVRLIREDGRNYLTHSAEQYDLISLEVGQLFRPGIASFYTEDFYRRAAERLRPGGVLAQLVPLPFLTEEQFRGVVRTFRAVFPEAVLWYNTSELLLLGSRGAPIELRSSRLALLGTPPVSDDLHYAYWGGPAQWLSRPGVFLGGFLCGPRGLAALADGAPVYRDDLPMLEYATVAVSADEPREVPTVHLLQRHLDPIEAVCEAVSPELLLEAEGVRDANVGDMIAAAHLRRVDDLKARGDLAGIHGAVEEALRHNPLNGTALRLRGDVLQRLGRLDEAQAAFEEALRIDEADALARRGLAFNLHLAGRVADAIPHYREALRMRPGDFETMNGLGGALAQTGQFQEATALFEETLRLRPDFVAARENLARVRRAAAGASGSP
jgi:spermidine synthase